MTPPVILQHVITETKRVEHRIWYLNYSATASCLMSPSLVKLPQPSLVYEHPTVSTAARFDPGGVETTLTVGPPPGVVLEERREENERVVTQNTIPFCVVERSHLRGDHLALQIEGTIGVEEQVRQHAY